MDKQNKIEAMARHWVVHMHSDSVNEKQLRQFRSWVAEDSAHALAVQEYEQLMEDLALVEELRDVPIHDQKQKTDSLGNPATDLRARASTVALSYRNLIVASMLVLAGVVSLVFTPQWFNSAPQTIYETQIAEVRDLVLDDGSKITIGALSKIKTHFSEQLRQVSLLKGEAFFDVTSDPDRPFYVHSGDRLVRVVGTQFEVLRGVDEVLVSVVEGAVQVVRGNNALKAEQSLVESNGAVLRAGDRIVARVGSDKISLSKVAPEDAGTWRHGWLVYEDVSLDKIIADVNRYNEVQITFASDDLKHLRMTAAFGTQQINGFLTGLSISHSIKAVPSDNNQIILHRVTEGIP